jgi:hypothetical protein
MGGNKRNSWHYARDVGTWPAPTLQTRCCSVLKTALQSKLEPEFDKVWEAAKDNLLASERVSMSQDFVRQKWQAETAEFRAEIEAQAEEMHRVAMEEWRAGCTLAEQSAEEYHK